MAKAIEEQRVLAEEADESMDTLALEVEDCGTEYA
jgi:hypothetical protein